MIFRMTQGLLKEDFEGDFDWYFQGSAKGYLRMDLDGFDSLCWAGVRTRSKKPTVIWIHLASFSMNFSKNMKASKTISLPILIFILSSLGPSEACWFPSAPPKPIPSFAIKIVYGLSGAEGNVRWISNTAGCKNLTDYEVGPSILYTTIKGPCRGAI